MRRFMIGCLSLTYLFAMTSQVKSDGGECGSTFSTTALPAPSSLHVGVILVQFSDWQTNVDARGSHCFIHGFDNDYTYQEFNRHLFSQDIYTSPSIKTHDEEDVFGSMRDFYDENSFGKFTLTGEILNDTTAAGIPIWVTISQTKPFRASLGITSQNARTLLDLALAADPSLSIAGFDRIIMIYAGIESGGRNALTPSTQNPERFVYQVGEKTGLPYGRTGTVGTFYGIGTHSHEFGHLLGLPDLKTGGSHPRGLGEFALMAVGNKGFLNGVHDAPDKGGFHAPAHMCGWSKLSLGWAVQENLTEGNMTFPHFEEDDQVCVFFINDNDHADWEEGEFFILENRRPTFTNGARTFDGDMQIPGQTGGLVIFHHNDSNFFNSLKLVVIEADNGTSNGTTVASSNFADFYPGTTSNTEFSANSTPSSNDVNNNPTGLTLLNITNTNGVVSAIVDFGPPAAPQNLHITNPASQWANPILEWDASSEPDLDHYLVWRGSTPNWKKTPITWEPSPAANVTGTTWTDYQTKIDLNTLNSTYYRVTAVDAANNESDYSSAIGTTSSPIMRPVLEDEPTPLKDPGTVFLGDDKNASLPQSIALGANHPNPFNPETRIAYALSEAASVTITIYNLAGQQITTLVNEPKGAGFFSVVWDGRDAAGAQVGSGVYIYRIAARPADGSSQPFVQSKKMVLVR